MYLARIWMLARSISLKLKLFTYHHQKKEISKSDCETREYTPEHLETLKIEPGQRSRTESESILNEKASSDDKTSAPTESRENFTEHPQIISSDCEFRNTNLQLMRDETVDQSREEITRELKEMENEESDDFVQLSYDDHEFSHDTSPAIDNVLEPNFPSHLSFERSPEPIMKSFEIKEATEHGKIDEQAADKGKVMSVDLNEKFIEMEKNLPQDSDVTIENQPENSHCNEGMIHSTVQILDHSGKHTLDVDRESSNIEMQLDMDNVIDIATVSKNIS